MKRIIALIAAAFALAFAPVAMAAPFTYYNQPFDTPNSAVNALITQLNSSSVGAQYTASCSGTTTATCTGSRIVVSVTGLTTAAGVT